MCRPVRAGEETCVCSVESVLRLSACSKKPLSRSRETTLFTLSDVCCSSVAKHKMRPWDNRNAGLSLSSSDSGIRSRPWVGLDLDKTSSQSVRW